MVAIIRPPKLNRDLVEITPDRFRREPGPYPTDGMIFKTRAGEIAVRGEMIYCFRNGAVPEAIIVINPEAVLEALTREGFIAVDLDS